MHPGAKSGLHRTVGVVTMVRRRTVVSLIGAGSATWSSSLQSQTPVSGQRRIGLLSFSSAPGGPNPDPTTGFFESLRGLGYVEGRNLVVESRYADGRAERLAGLAADLVRQNVALIVAGGPASIEAARAATTTIPIVAIGGIDPVGQGWAQSLARPGGNLTGLTVTFPELGPKLLEVLKEVRPGMVRAAVLGATAERGSDESQAVLEQGARALGLELRRLDVKDATEFESAFARAVQGGVEGLYVAATNLIVSGRRELAALALRHRLPAISDFSIMADAGFLLSYGTNLQALGRHAATFVDKILKGARPGDLPFERPTEFELVVNLHTARAMGFKLPAAILQRAERVIG